MLSVSTMKKIGLFAGGVLFGTAGVKILSSKDAKKVYTNCTAAALRAKDCVMKTATTMQENAEDIWRRRSRSTRRERLRKLRQCRSQRTKKMQVRKVRKRKLYSGS